MGYETPQSKRTFRKIAYRAYRGGISSIFEVRRRDRILQLIASRRGQSGPGRSRLLEVGCGAGKDFLRHVGPEMGFELFGLDFRDLPHRSGGFEFVKSDAANIPFPDAHFDVAVSIGVLEHIAPIAKLDRVTAEIARIARNFVVVVPSIRTRLEPHTMQLNWQLRAPKRKAEHDHLFYYSDEAWLQFSGFTKARVERFAYVPGLIENLLITNIPRPARR